MKTVSTKQRSINSELARIKKSLPKVCVLCHGYGNTLMHLMPRSLFGAYILEPKNLVIGCLECHEKFDDHILFRQKQTELIERCREFATSEEIFRYFKI